MKTIRTLASLAAFSLVLFSGCNKENELVNTLDSSSDPLLSKAAAVSSVPLGSASTFGVLGGTTVTNADESYINGDLGVSPGTAITGFQPEPINSIEGPGTVTAGLGIVTGTIYAGGPVAVQAQTDAAFAYSYLIDQVPGTILGDVYQLDGQTLTPGTYYFPTSANLQVNGQLILDFQGDNNSLFIFQLGTTLVTMSNSNVVAINTGSKDDCVGSNVWWAVGTSATIDGNSFIGTVIANTSITMTNTGNESGATNVSGRMLALNGAVTMVKSVIDVCGSSDVVNPPNDPICDWEEETAWSDGDRYVKRGNWATYTSYNGVEKTVTLFAGQSYDIGTVTFSAASNGFITITIELNEFGAFQDTRENVKVEGYAMAPKRNPAPGRFTYKGHATGSIYEIVVPVNNFYGVHVDAKRKDCQSIDKM
jgi:chitodextrinase